MKRFLVLSMAVTALLGVQALAAGDYPEIVTKKLYASNDLRGKTAPPLHVEKWLSGEAPITKGKVVLIDFWATWCPPCRELIPELNGYKKKFGDDLVVIGITNEDPEHVKTFMKSHQMEYNVGVDQSSKMDAALGIEGIPHVLLISPDNIVRWQGFPSSGEDELNADKIAQVIAASKSH